MESAEAYIPIDRRRAMVRGEKLPDRTIGAALFADISGFTPLAEALVKELGPKLGAEELTRQLNLVYDALIAEVHRYRGSVVTFGGDAIICWFDGDPAIGSKQAALRATACALAMQQVTGRTADTIGPSPSGLTVSLAIKAAVTSGPVRRFLVGTPQTQYIDVLAGVTLDRMARAEKQAQKGEVLLGPEVISQLGNKAQILEWRPEGETGQPTAGAHFAVVTGLADQVEATPWPPLVPAPGEAEGGGLTEAQIRPWLLPPIYERLKTGGGQFLAELRTALALFLRFGGLDYDQDDAAGQKLDAYICWVHNILAHYEGYLIQLTTGDKGSYLYAAFGAPLAHGDDAARAVAASLELRTPPSDLDFITGVQIGLSQGRMRAGPYGSSTRRTYGVQGSEVNAAARLMEEAEPGHVLISKHVAEAAAKNYDFKYLGPVKVKGKLEPIPVFDVLNRRLPAAQRPTTLVAYEEALAQLEQILESVLADQGQVLCLEGVTLASQSHLAADFIEQVISHGFQIARGTCQSPGHSIVYGPWQQIFRTWFDLAGESLAGQEATNWTVRQITQVETAIKNINPDWLPLLPLLGDLLGLPIPNNTTTMVFDPLLRQGVFLALAMEMIQTWAGQQPLLLLIEEAHWLDEASQELALALARSIAKAPVLLTLAHPLPSHEDKPLLPGLNQLPYYNHLKLHSKTEPVTVSRPHDQPQMTTPSRTTTTPRSDIIGRTTERTILTNRLQTLLYRGRGGAVLIEGEAGIGKSRLVTDLIEQAHTLGITILIGAGNAIEKSTSYHAWRPIFRQLFNLDGRPDTDTIIPHSQLLSLLPTDPELLRLAPLLNAVLPLRLPENEVTKQMTGQVRAENTQKLLTRLLQAAVTRSPTLLILEDAHWLDSASWTLTGLVSQQVHPVLFIIVTRPLAAPLPEEYSQLLHTAGTQQLWLEPLPPEEALTLVCQRLGVATLPETVAALIRMKAQGHPFFSEELAYALRDAGMIRIVAGKCQIAPDVEDFSAITLPDTIEDVITSRIDRLKPPQQLTLKVASVIGHVFLFRLLRDIHPIETDKSHLPEYLDTLEQLDITIIDTPEPNLAYIFKHTITQEVAYNLMLFTQRWALHRAVAEWVERTHADNLSPFYPLLAHHWRQAVRGQHTDSILVEKAIGYLEKAGAQALRNNANQEAIRFFNEALALDTEQRRGEVTEQEPAGHHIPPPGDSTQLRRARWERQLGQAHLGLGNLQQGRKHLEKALALLNWSVPTQDWRLAISLTKQVLRQILHRLWPTRFIEHAPDKRARLLEAARAYERLGEIYYWSNETVPAMYAALRILNLAERTGPSPELAQAYANVCLVAGFISLHFLAEAYSRRAQEAAHKLDHRPALAWVSEIIGVYATGAGRWTKAREVLEQAVLIFAHLENRRRWEECATTLSEVFYLQGKFADSLKLWLDITASARRRGDAQAQSWGLTGQLRCLLALGQAHTDEALSVLEALEALLAENIGSADAINLYGILALAHLRLGEPQLAWQTMDAATDFIAQSSPTGFGLIHGYTSAAELYLTLWAASDPTESPLKYQALSQSAWQTCQALHKYARAFPIGQPRAWLWQGLYDWLAGRPAKAHKAWHKSLTAAQRLSMPYDQGLAHYQIGRHLATDDPTHQSHLTRAREIFAQLNADYDLTRAEEGLGGM